MAQRTSPFASWKPTQKDLDFVAGSAGNNWRSLLTHLGIDLADIESFKNESLGETKDACFKGLVHWLKGNVPDEPVTFGTLFEALEDAKMTGCISKLENRLKAKSRLKRADQDLSTQINSAANSENQEAIKQLQLKLVKLEKELKHSKPKEQAKANSVLQEAIKQVQKELEELKVTVAKDSKSDHMKAKDQAKANIENQEVIKRLQQEMEEVRKAEKESKAQPSPVTQDHIKHLESQIQSLLKHQQQLQSDLDRVHLRSNPSPMQPIPADNPRTKPTSSSGQFLAMGCHGTRSGRETKYIAAIDFGSTFTGVAYAAKKPDIKPFDVEVKNDWKNTEQISRKVPTSVLFSQFDHVIAYGYEAEAEARASENALFRHFKMSLHSHNMNKLDRDMTLTSLDGRTKKPAFEVVSKALAYLGVLVRDFIKMRTRQDEPPRNLEITWVITVPAIWSFSLRQFMRDAVKKAGLCSADCSNLVIALEPECAALYLEHKHGERKNGRYAIVDCGGGTVDVSYHHCQPSGNNSYTIDELKEPTGEPKGGTLADRKFEALIDDIFGYGSVAKVQRENVGDYLHLMNDFEKLKSSINDAKAKNVTYFRFLPNVQRSIGGVSIKKVKITIQDDKFSSLFEEPVEWIRSHLAENLRTMKSVDQLYFTGGFSLCKLLQDRVSRNLEPRLIFPVEEELAVVKGGVIFANNPRIVRSRKMGMSYGIECNSKYDPVKHKGRATAVYGGVTFCDNVFDPLICKGDTITDSDEKVSTYKFKDAQNAATFSIYASPDQYVQYTDDPGCELIGSMTLQMPDTGPRSGGKKTVELYTSFTGKELHIRAHSEVDNTKICCVVSL